MTDAENKAAEKKAAEDAANIKKNTDAEDPANKAGSTGNAATMTGGIRHVPSKHEDDHAKAQAKAAGKGFEKEMDAGNSRAATRLESEAIRDGASVLGKEAVVVTGPQGQPMVARRGMPGNAGAKASATNPALTANRPDKDTPLHA